MHDNQIALITGANKGIGLTIAKNLAKHGLTVLVGSRDLANGETAAQGIDGDAHAIELDVTDEASITAAADRIRDEFGRLDVLVNNAGISHATPWEEMPGTTFEEKAQSGQLSKVSLDELREIFDTNVFGALAVTHAALPLLRESPSPRVVMVSSGVGSLAAASQPGNRYRAMFGAYSASKAAMNAITVGLAISLESEGVRVNAISPGFVATDLNNHRGVLPVEEGGRDAIRLALQEGGPTGTFTDQDGDTIPW